MERVALIVQVAKKQKNKKEKIVIYEIFSKEKTIKTNKIGY